ncbi:GDNF family receptor alpha-like isoform X2 [Echeneis naucrates]|uniref:GDNF family receptor alpha-like isoform X2 n=1 Tax=Echeneis naucrates TaxID=173247 RepID=UPI0011139453|nr:GDNF family receptor alpha-like isoform X2 [Echeneis naucrates]
MQLTCLEAAVILGIVLPQITSINISSATSDCLSAVNICMSDLCRSERALYGSICNSKSLQKRSTLPDWASSSLNGHGYAASCLDLMTACVSDTVCNKGLVPVLQACRGSCGHERCQQVTQAFYGSMPRNIADMLVMCDCDASNERCLHMKAALHSASCEDETQICQETVHRCLADSNCRDPLKAFQAKCWRFEDTLCNGSDAQSDECFASMDPALILGADPGCKRAFMATLGTALHRPCSCKGMHNDELKTCSNIHDVIHNRSHFVTSWKSSSGPTKPPEINNSQHNYSWSHDHLLYAFVTLVLIAVVVIMPLAFVSKIWLLRKSAKKALRHPHKSNCVAIL